MRNFITLAALAAGAACAASPAAAFDFVTVKRTVEVNRPAAAVWSKVGGYCAIGDWLKVKCAYKSGSGGAGTVRLLNDQVEEVMVGQTALSYTYQQNVGPMTPNLYHGTLDVVPVDAGHSRIVYTLVYDQQPLSAADKTAQNTRLNERFQAAIETMKKMAEGG
jgi:hypothetical protein